MKLELLTAPTIEPIDYSDMEKSLGLLGCDIDEDDEEYITELIAAAREYCEAYQSTAYLTQTWRLILKQFPTGYISIPKGEVQSVTSVKYRDRDNVQTTLTVDVDYIVTDGNKIIPIGTFPTDLLSYDAVEVVWVAGWSDKADVPYKVKQAIKLLVGHWYQNRTPIDDTRTAPQEISFTLSALLNMDGKILL